MLLNSLYLINRFFFFLHFKLSLCDQRKILITKNNEKKEQHKKQQQQVRSTIEQREK